MTAALKLYHRRSERLSRSNAEVGPQQCPRLEFFEKPAEGERAYQELLRLAACYGVNRVGGDADMVGDGLNRPGMPGDALLRGPSGLLGSRVSNDFLVRRAVVTGVFV